MPSLFSQLRSQLFKKESAATVPDGERVYAVGDIHGCCDQLNQLLDAIVADANSFGGRKHLIFLGDYVDRGPDSKGVIDRLMAPPPGFSVAYLRGNHDQVVLDFLADPSIFRVWRDYGARETLMSYGVLPPRFDDESAYVQMRDQLLERIPSAHVDFLGNLQMSKEIGGYYFVHAGVRPGVRLDQQVAEDQMWIREEFLNSADEFGKVVVHGHTPAAAPVVRKNRVGVDTGAYATGRLSAAVLENAGVRFLASKQV